MKKYDVTAIGELLIDFTENGVSAQGNPMLEANPGGAPCNVLAMLHKLGHSTSFIGKVGRDHFGDLLEAAAKEAAEKAARERSISIATNLWNKGERDLQQIADLTDLPLDEVKKLFEGKTA